MAQLEVRALMSKRPKFCGPEDTLDRAAQIMWEEDVGFVPVVDSEQRVIGVVTDRDLCMAEYTQGGSMRSHPVSSAMARTIYSCAPSDVVSMAEQLMRQYQLRRLPVVEDDKLVGVISLNDIAVAAASPSNDLTFEEVGRTLASVSSHRAPSASA
jgi:CBS domain-containing protein